MALSASRLLWAATATILLCTSAFADSSDLQHGLAALDHGVIADALPLLTRAYQDTASSLPDSQAHVTAALGLATAYMVAGQTTKAEQIVAPLEQVFERTRDMNLLESVNVLSAVRTVQGRWDEAERLLRRAIDSVCPSPNSNAPIGEGCLDHREVRDAAVHLANVFAIRGETARADTLLTSTLKAARHNGDFAVEISILDNNLGRVQTVELHLDDAAQSFTDALSQTEKSGNVVLRAEAMSNLAFVYLLSGHNERALPLFRSAVHLFEQSAGASSPRTAMAIAQLGYSESLDGKHTSAKDHLERAWGMLNSALGPNDVGTNTVAVRLAQAHLRAHEYESAERFLRPATRRFETMYPHGHLAVAVAYRDLAEACEHNGKLDEAGNLYRKSIAMFDAVAPDDHGLVNALQLYAAFESKRDRKEAKALRSRAAKITNSLRHSDPMPSLGY